MLQLSFGLRATVAQFNLNNRFNISDNLVEEPLIDTPANITDQILILFVDGMRYDKMLEATTPNIDFVRSRGISFSNFRAVLPSYSKVNYAAFSTGSTTNFTNVFANGFRGKLQMPTLFSQISIPAINRSIISGSSTWLDFLGKDANITIKIDSEYHEADEGVKVRDAAIDTITNNFTKITFIGFNDVDAIGHKFGAASAEYQAKIEEIDSYIGDIITTYDSLGELNKTTIVLFSDHGMADIGGHGGEEDTQTHATLVLAGKGIRTNTSEITSRVTMNSVAPTLIAMTGYSLAPTMNGPILFDAINVTKNTTALYQIQYAKIFQQQAEKIMQKIKVFSSSYRDNVQYLLLNNFNDNTLKATDYYFLNNTEEAVNFSKIAERNARIILHAIVLRHQSLLRTIRSVTILVIILLVIVTLAYLIQKNILSINFKEIINKQLILPEIIGAASAVILGVIIFAATGTSYDATSFNNVAQPLVPNLLSYFLGGVLAIFLPWAVIYLQKRKNEKKPSFKSLKNDFLKATIGSVFILSLPVISYFFIYIAKNGPWPNAYMPILAEYYAYIIISSLMAILYIVPIGFLIALWRSNKKLQEKRLKDEDKISSA
jgi:hypothetical protein